MERLEDRCGGVFPDSAKWPLTCPGETGGRGHGRVRLARGGALAARERRVVLGKRQEVIVLALAGGLSVELPMERARELLRPLASEADMSRVQKTLDAARREWTLPAKGNKSQLSPGERELFVKARQLLSNEIALACGVEPAEANAWIDGQLTRTG